MTRGTDFGRIIGEHWLSSKTLECAHHGKDVPRIILDNSYLHLYTLFILPANPCLQFTAKIVQTKGMAKKKLFFLCLA